MATGDAFSGKMRAMILEGPSIDPARWLWHTPMTEPGAFSAEFNRLPSDIASLNRIIHGLLVHSEWLWAYGLDASAFPSISRTTLPVGERLGALSKSRIGELSEARIPAQRSAGTCRDFALMLCSFLRAKGIPARLRCGFAAYLGDGWEDHWICEYWDGKRREWRTSDAQLDEIMLAGRQVSFDPSNVPREVFLTAGEAWSLCRAGREDADRFGHGDVKGLWFMKVNVVRDSYAMNNRETSSWDRWREAAPEARTVPMDELPKLDGLARHPEARLGDQTPDWLTGL